MDLMPSTERDSLFNLRVFRFLSQSISLPRLNNANKFTLNVRVTLQPHPGCHKEFSYANPPYFLVKVVDSTRKLGDSFIRVLWGVIFSFNLNNWVPNPLGSKQRNVVYLVAENYCCNRFYFADPVDLFIVARSGIPSMDGPVYMKHIYGINVHGTKI
ncbi:hypothetical protein P8452_42717 [Trifolium repens]|nr:hypothetical protein P8452_42717 [Trifolium repens]